jgi:hypothetical protein
MPYHVRRQIRDALGTLVTGLATTGARVYLAPVVSIPIAQLPALAVWVDEEALELATGSAPMEYARTITVRVVGFASEATGLSGVIDNTLDQIALELEAAIGGDATLLGGILNSPLELVAIGVERSAEGEAPLGRITLTYTARVETSAAAPESPL